MKYSLFLFFVPNISEFDDLCSTVSDLVCTGDANGMNKNYCAVISSMMRSLGSELPQIEIYISYSSAWVLNMHI